MGENIRDLVTKLFQAHQKPIVKLNTGGTKIFIPKSDESEAINKNLTILKDTLGFPRVERRNVRSEGVFLRSERIVSVTRLVNLQNFGYRNKHGMYFRLEEALYLLESNRLEILFNNQPISVQEAYNLFLDDNLTLNKYRAYKKLISDGFKIERFREIEIQLTEPPSKKIKVNTKEIGTIKETNDVKTEEIIDKNKGNGRMDRFKNTDEIDESVRDETTKRIQEKRINEQEKVNEGFQKEINEGFQKETNESLQGETSECLQEEISECYDRNLSKERQKIEINNKINDIFKKLKKKAPMEFKVEIENKPDYVCNSTKDKNKNVRYDVHLVQEEFDSRIGFYSESNQNLFGILSNDDISFYRISRIRLPNLLELEK